MICRLIYVAIEKKAIIASVVILATTMDILIRMGTHMVMGKEIIISMQCFYI